MGASLGLRVFSLTKKPEGNLGGKINELTNKNKQKQRTGLDGVMEFGSDFAECYLRIGVNRENGHGTWKQKETEGKTQTQIQTQRVRKRTEGKSVCRCRHYIQQTEKTGMAYGNKRNQKERHRHRH